MNPLDLIPAPYRYAAIAIVITIVLAVTYFTGRSHGLERYYDYKSSVESQMEIIRQENAERLAAMADTAKHAADGWESARAELARRPRVVRVQPNSCAGEMPGLSATSAAVEGLHASSGESWITANQCEQIANDSTLDREWIETVKQLTDKWHKDSK